MAYYIFIQDNKINGCGQCEQLTEGVLNIEVEEHLFNTYGENPEMYIWDGEAIIIDPEYEQKQAQKEKERIAKLSLTKREAFLGLYQAKGVTPEQIKAQITDPMALIEFEYANDYYRFNPLIDVVGNALGITSEQLDRFFETGDYTCLLDPQKNQAESEVEPMNDPSLTHETEVFNLEE